MKFSTKTTYGIKAMINLANSQGKESISLSKIAKEENISVKYLERIFSKLKKANIVRSEKGMSGGYCLKEPPANINIFEIINALEGKTQFYCLDKEKKVFCSNKCKCKATEGLLKVEKMIDLAFKNIKLNDLL